MMYVNRYTKTIRPEEKVIDLGSGDNPHPRADIYVDFFDDGIHREGAKLVVPQQGQFIKWDLNKYPFPFKNKEFDFVICSHIIEHINNPAYFCNEIQRIGKRGYIETPNKLYEQIYGWSFHQWYVYALNDELIFERKKGQDFFAPIGHKLYKYNKEFYEGHHKNIEQLLTSFYWEDSFSFKVIDSDTKSSKKWHYINEEEINQELYQVPIKYPFFIKKFLNLFIQTKK